MPNYDPELDIVLETGDGSFASCCIAWRDDALGIGSFEPLGTRPTWRAKRSARQVICEGLRRLRARGMHSAQVETAGFNTPAQALYESCGVRELGRCLTYMKRVAG